MDLNICRGCSKTFSDIKSYRKYVCRECYNSRQRQIMKERSMTLEGYLQAQIISIRNHPLRSRLELDITVEFLVGMYNQQNGKCALSDIELQFGHDRKNPFTMSIDRIDSDKGYTTDNVQLVISALNLFKSNYDIKDIHHIAEKFVNNYKIPV